jgi:hypothetical protein
LENNHREVLYGLFTYACYAATIYSDFDAESSSRYRDVPQYSLLKMLELAALKSLQRASVDSEAKLKQASSDNFKPAWFQRVASDVKSLKTGT